MTVELQVEGKKSDLETAESDISKRDELLAALDQVIERSLRAFGNKYTPGVQRQGWGRLIAVCAKVSAELLKDVDLEELLRRVELLEQSVKGR